MPTLFTFGDSVLDCAVYNDEGVHPGALLVRNEDALFPAFRGRDLATLGAGWALEHRAVDGATLPSLPRQRRGATLIAGDLALVTIGGNDLLGGLALDPTGAAIARFGEDLDAFLATLAPAKVLLGNVYDPTFGDDRRNFLGVDPALPRRNLARMNALLASRPGTTPVDVHGRFLQGTTDLFTRVIEPSLRGASEVRAAFLPAVLAHATALLASFRETEASAGPTSRHAQPQRRRT